MKIVTALLLVTGIAFAQGASLGPGQSMTITVSLLAPSPKLTPQQMAAVRNMPMRAATKAECDPFPCRMGRFTTYVCPQGYAHLNQWSGIIASSIPDGEGTVMDVWDEDKFIRKCQNVDDWKSVLSLAAHRNDGFAQISNPIPKELR